MILSVQAVIRQRRTYPGCLGFVATPPNLIVYGSGFISIRSMMISGVALNIIGIIIIALISVFLIPYVMS